MASNDSGASMDATQCHRGAQFDKYAAAQHPAFPVLQ